MKLKVNSRILLAMIAIVMLVLGSCSTPPTIAAIIIDQRGNPVPKAGVTVTATYNNQKTSTATTQSDGSAKLPLTNAVYPVVITASDNIHEFSKFTLQAATDAAASQKITITESMLIIRTQ